MQKTTSAAFGFINLEEASDMPDAEALVGPALRVSCWRQGRFATAIALSFTTGLALTACSPAVRHLTKASPTSSISEDAIPILDPTSDGPFGLTRPSATSNIFEDAIPILDPTSDGPFGVDYESEYRESDLLLVPNFTTNGIGWPSLFCWCIMLTVDNHPMGWKEEKLIKQQLELGIGIFACNEWAVMSDISVTLNRWGARGFPRVAVGKPGPADMPSWAIGSTSVQKGVESNPLNSVIFKTAWDALRSSHKLESHDWVVKVHPDAVWFPSRLRTHLKVYMDGHGDSLTDQVYLHNCVRFQATQGPIEVMSKRAATTLQNNMKQCGGLWGTGEDQFLITCLKQFAVTSHVEDFLLNDKDCDGHSNCYDASKVAFHPYEDTEGFIGCHGSASQAAVESWR